MRRLPSPRILLWLALPAFLGAAAFDGCLPPPWLAQWDRVVVIEAGPDFEDDFREAAINATPGTIIELAPGHHVMEGTITVETSHVIIRGAGMVLPDAAGDYDTRCPGSPTEHCGTVLDYLGQAFGSQGILGFGDHFALESLSILNTRGDGAKTQDVTGARFSRVHVAWPDVPDLLDHGAYGLYPAESTDVEVNACDVRGSRDAGIYIGQSENVIVRYSHVRENVLGIEIENSKNADVYGNVAEANTGGIAVFNLPNLKDGYGTRVFDNKIIENDTPNFAAGGILALVPGGTGLIVIGGKDVRVYDNEIRGNDTVNVIVSGFQISFESIDDADYDPYAEQVLIGDNDFGPGGSSPVQFGTIVQGLFDGFCRGLPLAEVLAHDGCRADTSGGSCTVDDQGTPDPADDTLPGFCVTGRPPDVVFGGWIDPAKIDPTCAFDRATESDPCPDKALSTWLGQVSAANRNCLQDPDALVGTLNAYQGAVGGLDLYDRTPFDCTHDDRLPVLMPPPTDPPEVDAGLTPEERDLLCEGAGDDPATVNWDAYVANCLYLDQYRLFEDDDPRGTARDGGFPYDLTSPLFSDHARKDRYVFLPPGPGGERVPMAYSADGVFDLPVGTIITKTFSFQDVGAGTDRVVETRLLIHRPDGWEGLPFVPDETTGRFELAIGGHVAEDVRVSEPDGTSHVFDYPVPDMAQCGTCHFGPTGDDPIGPKARLLNRGLGAVANQLEHYVAEGILVDGADPVPVPASAAPRIPFPHDPGDGSLEARAKGYLESNCAHCHNPEGRAGFTSLHLTWDHPVDIEYGVCKRPIAAGGGAFTDAFGARVGIEPGDAGRSILWRRMESTDPAKMMPELSRVLAHAEGLDLVAEWIDVDLAPRAGECDLLEPPGGSEPQ